jgi:hypothetical protein
MSLIRDGVVADGDVALACWRVRHDRPSALVDVRDIINGHDGIDAAYIGATIQKNEGGKYGEFERWLLDGMPEIKP